MALSMDAADRVERAEQVTPFVLDSSSDTASRSSDDCEVSQPPAKRLRRACSEEVHAAGASDPTKEVEMKDGASSSSSSESSSSEYSVASTALVPLEYPLVGREAESGQLDRFLESSLDQGGRGGCLYVSGGPGTGKTCSVRLAAKAWKERDPEVQVVEVNCMELGQPSVAGLLQRIASLPVPGIPVRRSGRCGSAGGASRDATAPPRAGCSGRSGQGLPAAAVARLAALGPRVVLVLDEVDQLVRRQQTASSGRSSGGGSLEALLSLPRMPGAPALAIVAIANAVDLLERGALPTAPGLCETLLFQPYSADQLRCIVKARLAAAGPTGEAAEKALGRVAIELRVRQVAKRSGDCRPVVCLCEQALFEQGRATEAAAVAAEADAAAKAAATAEAAADGQAAAGGSAAPTTPLTATEGSSSPSSSSSCGTPPRVAGSEAAVPQLTPAKRPAPGKDPAGGDPLGAIQQLPMEQQVLLCTLAGLKGEAVRLAELCGRYKEMCKKLHQKENLSSKQQVSNAVSSLEQRGLLGLRSKKGGARGRAVGNQLSQTECVVELAVSCAAVRERISQANPLLQKCLE